MTDTVVLWGLSGSGKTSVGAALAARLRHPFADTDAMIERETGRTVVDIFATDGEARFRELERGAIARAMSTVGAVVSVGGGAILDPANRVRLAGGRTVWLRAPIDVLVARLRSASDRPLLAGEPATKLRVLLEQRERWYRRAEIGVETAGRGPDDVAAEIAERIGPAPYREARPMRIQSGGGAYRVVSGQNVLDTLPDLLRELKLPPRAWVVSDSGVAPHYGERVLAALERGGFAPQVFTVPEGEPSKDLTQASALWDWLAEQGAERSEAVVALGGGVVGDLVGFVAATYLRGVPLVQVPTSLLAQVDSSVGGKTAIDHPRGKNMIGAFYPARLVLVDTAFLHGLPPEQVSAGWAEVLKYGVILDAELFDLMLARGDDLLNLAPAPTIHAIRRSLAIKAHVVEQDERESRLRMVLNFGHTIGHALESSTGYARFLHGHAVALGMLGAGWIAVELGLFPPGDFDRLRRGIAGLALPMAAPGVDVGATLRATLHDKKVKGRRIQWILPIRIGEVTISDAVPERLVERAIELVRDGAFAAEPGVSE